MAGLISHSAIEALKDLLSPAQGLAQTRCTVRARRPANPAEYAAALRAAVGDDPPPYDPWGTQSSPVAELDARSQLAVGMTVWQLGRFMRVSAVQAYKHDCGSLCSAQISHGKEITFTGADGSTSCRLVGGEEPVPVYCWLG